MIVSIDPEFQIELIKNTETYNKQGMEKLERLFKTLQPEQYDKLKNW